MLSAVVPGPDGRLRDELRAGVAAHGAGRARTPGPSSRPGDEVLAAVGAAAVAAGAGAEFCERTGARAVAST